MDGCVRELIECGVPPLAALRTATLTPAEYFRLYDRGAIAPGKIADLVLVDSLESCRVLRVWKRGRLVAERGKILESLAPAAVSELPGLKQTVRTPTPDELKIKLGPDDKYINVIGVVPRQFTTETLTLEPAVIDGCACADPSRRLAKMAVVEKNRGTGRLALGFLHNFPLERGAVASSVAHDAHNYTCAGMDDVSMSTALRELARMHGGIVVAEGEKVLASLELPVGGLMSLLSAAARKARGHPRRSREHPLPGYGAADAAQLYVALCNPEAQAYRPGLLRHHRGRRAAADARRAAGGEIKPRGGTRRYQIKAYEKRPRLRGLFAFTQQSQLSARAVKLRRGRAPS